MQRNDPSAKADILDRVVLGVKTSYKISSIVNLQLTFSQLAIE